MKHCVELNCVMAHSHQIKIATDWLQTGFWLASHSKIGVNETMQDQCNPTAFYQSGASLKPVGSQSVAILILVWMSHKNRRHNELFPYMLLK